MMLSDQLAEGVSDEGVSDKHDSSPSPRTDSTESLSAIQSPMTKNDTATDNRFFEIIVDNANQKQTGRRRRSPAMMDPKQRHRFHTKAALIMTACTVVLLLGLASFFSVSPVTSDNEMQEFHHHHRILEDNNNNNDNGDDNNNNNNNNDNDNDDNDYSQYSCGEIFTRTSIDDTSQRCSFARSCNGGPGIFASFVFCRNETLTTHQWCAVLGPLLLLWLVLLFRMLGSTAEDYFSPSLEMFSLKMGLPPRFAGVTLLALGNGAADVSATVNAIISDPKVGYRMSLGALTGAGMFVGTVVAGVVIVVADGVKCRGALVRDVIALVLTVGAVFIELERGYVGPAAVTLFFGMYLLFVVIVLIADVYHRAVVIPRIKARAERRERERQMEEGRRAAEVVGDVLEEVARASDPDVKVEEIQMKQQQQQQQQKQQQKQQLVLQQIQPVALQTPLPHSSSSSSGGSESPFILNGSAGVPGVNGQTVSNTDNSLSNEAGGRVTFNPSCGARQGCAIITDNDDDDDDNENRGPLNAILLALSNYDRSEMELMTAAEHDGTSIGGAGVAGDGQLNDRPIILHGANGILNRHHARPSQAEGTSGGGAQDENSDYFCDTVSPYTAMMESMDGIDGICAEDGYGLYGATSWRGAFRDFRQELKVHREEVWSDIVDNEENNRLDKFLLICELPFTLFRKLTVPIPCEGYYCRALVALSMAVSPVWFGVYFLLCYNINLFWLDGFSYVLVFCIAFTFFGALVMRFAPSADGVVKLWVAVPIAFYGFVMAATWIDFIADHLVSLLDFLGAICRIPNSIMGLTILAWGNSMGDLSANMTMARKGLANMAMTACFAGPVFNILIGLGWGFSALSTLTGNVETAVKLSPSITTGFAFLLCNCALIIVCGVFWFRGLIPKAYGYVALALYTAYVGASVAIQFTRYRD